MRTVAFLGLLSEIDSDAGLSRKAQVVGGICFSKALFWDSKYHVRRRRTSRVRSSRYRIWGSISRIYCIFEGDDERGS